jgi:hypothetical protein
MTYISSSSVRSGAWATVGANSEITYHVLPDVDVIEFTLGGPNGLDLEMSLAALRRCVAAFTGALDAFDAATASQE